MNSQKIPQQILLRDLVCYGDEGNRTPVQVSRHNRVYVNSLAI